MFPALGAQAGRNVEIEPRGDRSAEESTHYRRSRDSGNKVGGPLDELRIKADLLGDILHLQE
jgi:hypothetical protein